MKKSSRQQILLVEDDELFRDAIMDFLTEKYAVSVAASAEKALPMLRETMPDLVLLDITLPGMDGIELLKALKNFSPYLPVIMLTAIDRIPKVVESIKLGAYDYLAKPVDAEELLLTCARALEAAEMRRELEQRRHLQLAKNVEYKIVGSSPALNKIRNDIEIAGKAETIVLIQGETGTGKELVARAIHAGSAFASGPFVAINCGAIPKDLVESELFGHHKGAFTGAQKDQMGKIQLAHHGTLLLDEISELPVESQSKLLRVLEEQAFYPVGSSDLVRVDVRIIASTNRNLAALMERQLFREDLFYRLNVFQIAIPPLRERREDILELAAYFIEAYNQKFGKNFQTLNAGAKAILLEYPWKGNVRELRNLIERIILAEKGATIKKEHLRFLANASPAPLAESSFHLPDRGLDLEEMEKSLMRQALKIAKWNKTRAAKLLHLSPPTFYYRLVKYGLD